MLNCTRTHEHTHTLVRNSGKSSPPQRHIAQTVTPHRLRRLAAAIASPGLTWTRPLASASA